MFRTFVASDGFVERTGTDGTFMVQPGGGGQQIAVRAYGYGRTAVSIEELERAEGQIELARLRPRALYLTALGLANRSLRQAALEIDALVIDVKGDRGVVAFPTGVPLAIVAGADRSSTISSLKELTDSLHARGIYAIARIVVFKDNVLALARPDLAVKTDPERLSLSRPGGSRLDRS